MGIFWTLWNRYPAPHLLKDTINSLDAPAIAKNMGSKITEILNAESVTCTNLITVNVTTTEGVDTAAGPLFGNTDARVVRISNFRLDVVPKKHLALIHNIDAC